MISEGPFGRPIVPNESMRAVLKLCVEWYAIPGNECGGCLHIVLDDDNVGDGDLSWCLERTKDERAIAIIEGLRRLSIMQRWWVTCNIYNVKEGKGEREISDYRVALFI